jgi:hypothetical protein
MGLLEDIGIFITKINDGDQLDDNKFTTSTEKLKEIYNKAKPEPAIEDDETVEKSDYINDNLQKCILKVIQENNGPELVIDLIFFLFENK